MAGDLFDDDGFLILDLGGFVGVHLEAGLAEGLGLALEELDLGVGELAVFFERVEVVGVVLPAGEGLVGEAEGGGEGLAVHGVDDALPGFERRVGEPDVAEALLEGDGAGGGADADAVHLHIDLLGGDGGGGGAEGDGVVLAEADGGGLDAGDLDVEGDGGVLVLGGGGGGDDAAGGEAGAEGGGDLVGGVVEQVVDEGGGFGIDEGDAGFDRLGGCGGHRVGGVAGGAGVGSDGAEEFAQDVNALAEVDEGGGGGAVDLGSGGGHDDLADDVAGVEQGDDLAPGVEDGAAGGAAGGGEVVLDEQAGVGGALGHPPVGAGGDDAGLHGGDGAVHVHAAAGEALHGEAEEGDAVAGVEVVQFVRRSEGEPDVGRALDREHADVVGVSEGLSAVCGGGGAL